MDNQILLNEIQSPRRYKPLVIILRVFDAATEEMEREWIRTIDSKERREWLNKTVMWATMNGKSVEIVNQKDD